MWFPWQLQDLETLQAATLLFYKEAKFHSSKEI